jgi:hypothetical protein
MNPTPVGMDHRRGGIEMIWLPGSGRTAAEVPRVETRERSGGKGEETSGDFFG